MKDLYEELQAIIFSKNMEQRQRYLMGLYVGNY